jgi:HAE1 family hydrophobic/amphiphilic exporter-1
MQKLAEICVKRPVFATMLIAALTVIGGVSFFQLGVDRYPRIESPVVSVTTSNPGATPESIEAEVTDRVEAAVNTVAGIDELRSTSTEGQSRVTITFDLSKNPDVAAQEVRAKVDPVIRNLPETADPPVVQKQDPDAMPLMFFSVSAPMSAVELTTYLEQNVQTRGGASSRSRSIRIASTRTPCRRPTSPPPCAPRTSSCQAAASSRGRASCRCAPWAA